MPQDRIIQRGEWGDEFFIVNQGSVVVLDTDDVTPTAVLRDGSYFGELAALLGGRRQRSVAALTHCFLSSLKHRALEQILKAHPECIDNLIANMANSKSYDFDEVKQRLIQLGGRTDDNDDDDDSASSRDEVLEEELDMCTGAMGASSASSIEHGGAPIGVPSPLRAGGAPR